jgi:hypothetical protein
MRNIIPVNKYLIILRKYLVLEHLSLNRHIIFPEHFKKTLEEKNCIQQRVFKLEKQACFGGKFLAYYYPRMKGFIQVLKYQRLDLPSLLL